MGPKNQSTIVLTLIDTVVFTKMVQLSNSYQTTSDNYNLYNQNTSSTGIHQSYREI